MSIKELVKQFNNGATHGTASDKRVRIEGDNLINYDTIIATRTNKGIELNIKKYSRTTTKLQNLIQIYCNVVNTYEGDNATIYASWN